MTYNGIRFYNDHEHLGGNPLEGDPYTYAPNTWLYLINRFCIESMLDVGSGLGHCPWFFFKHGVKCLALDGLEDNIKNAVYPTVQWDITKGPFKTKVHLTHCQEVVEHIEEKHIQNLIDTLKCGKYICITHAVPEQGGHHHVNCQTTEYWFEVMKNNNCYLLEEDTERIREISLKDKSGYLGNTGLLFCNRDF